MSVSGERIRKLREEKGWSQLELSKRANINNSVLSRIESGKRPVEDGEINTFADIFDVTADYILGRSIARTPEQGMAFSGGGKDWTEEEIRMAEAIAAAAIENMRKQQGK